MKRLQLILLVLILFLVPNVFALEVDVTNNITSPETSGTGKYRGTEILNTGTQATYNVKTRYQGRLSRIIYNLPLPSELGDCFTTNATYTITMYMETNDWNNKFGTVKVRPYSSSSTNWSNGNVIYVSYKKIYFTFKIPSSDTTCYDFVWVDLPSTNLTNTGITQVSNWNLNKITLTDPTINSGSGGGTSPTPTPDSSQAIINNQTENTNNIINNQNDNTQNIIENNNQNTQDIINNQNELLGDCVKNLMDDNLIVELFNVNQRGNSFTQIESDTSNNISLQIQSFNNSDYLENLNQMYLTSTGYFTLSFVKTSSFNRIRYKINGSVIDTGIMIDVSSLENGKTYYIKSEFTNIIQGQISFRNLMITDKNIDGFIAWGAEFCTSKLDETTNAINQQNEYLMDNSDPNITDNEFLNTFNSIGVNDPLSYLLTLPTQLINKIVSLSDTCTAINLGTLYGTMLTLPCINIENIVGTSVWNIIDVIFSVSLLVVIFKNLYDTFSNLITMGAQKEAKEKFSMPTPMDFLSMILGGDR